MRVGNRSAVLVVSVSQNMSKHNKQARIFVSLRLQLFHLLAFLIELFEESNFNLIQDRSG